MSEKIGEIGSSGLQAPPAYHSPPATQTSYPAPAGGDYISSASPQQQQPQHPMAQYQSPPQVQQPYSHAQSPAPAQQTTYSPPPPSQQIYSPPPAQQGYSQSQQQYQHSYYQQEKTGPQQQQQQTPQGPYSQQQQQQTPQGPYSQHQQQQQGPYPQQPQQGQQQPPQQWQRTVPLQALQESPAPVNCPACGGVQLTRTNYKVGNTTNVWALVLCLVVCLGCIPYLISGTKDVEHYCSKCSILLATWHRSGRTEVHYHG